MTGSQPFIRWKILVDFEQNGDQYYAGDTGHGSTGHGDIKTLYAWVRHLNSKYAGKMIHWIDWSNDDGYKSE